MRADAHYTRVHDGTRERMCPWSISEAEAQLDPSLFLRVHRSHIVAIPHVALVRKEGDGAVLDEADLAVEPVDRRVADVRLDHHPLDHAAAALADRVVRL